MMSSAIEIKSLYKKYKDVVAVNNIDLSILEGELFALLGENGAGKTTTIKCITGLTDFDSGSISILGYDIKKDANTLKEIVNLAPQESAYCANLTVKENLDLIINLYNFSKEKKQELLDNVINQLKLGDYLNKKAKALSGGYKRRLSIAMSIITNPKILILDEPTLGLDVRARSDLWKVIKSLKGKITIILTTHYMEEAENLADNIAIMNKGKIKANGSLSELKKLSSKDTLEDIFLYFTEEE